MPNDQTRFTNSLSRGEHSTSGAMSPTGFGMSDLIQCHSVLLSHVIGMANDMREFSQSRLQGNLLAWKSLMSCQHPGGMVGLQREYVEDATLQYRDYAMDLSKRAQQFARGMTPRRRGGGES